MSSKEPLNARVKKRKYIVYVDILGFERLAREIAEKKRLEPRKVRTDFVEVIKTKVEMIKNKGMILGEKYGESDDWLLVTNSLDMAFRVISEILNHHTGYQDYERIPLEIGVGVGEYDKWAEFEGMKLTVEDSTIRVLKPNIIRHYHDWCRGVHRGKRVTSTFIVLTESVYDDLEPLDKKMVQKVKYRGRRTNGGEIVFFVADMERVLCRGKVFEFLERIGHPDSKLYDRIEDLYVPPFEYEKVKKALETDRIVFITGPAEYGKTFTAVRLLWEYFNQGYEPVWRPGGEKHERRDVRERLEEIGSELKSHQRIIYFEDPFGKTRYEKREGLEREIGTILDCIRNVEDVYVIMTSREEIFKEFAKEQSSSEEIRNFETKLNVRKPSYDYEGRKEILLKWAESKGCKWLENEHLRDFVLNQIKDGEKLSTPLSIKDFVYSTIDITEEDGLREKIENKSEETAMSFAKEIKNMTKDKILFLSLTFVDYLRIDVAKILYERLARKLNIRGHWEFDRLLDWFKYDKITISNNRIAFSHPSYFRALECLLFERGYSPSVNRILSKALFQLSEWNVVGAIDDVVHYFDAFSEEAKVLLFKLAKRGETASAVASAIYENFDKLSDDSFRNKLLLKLSEKDEAAGNLAWVVVENFEKLPKNLRYLLFKLSEEQADVVADAVPYSFGKLPAKMRNKLLLKLSKRDDFAVENVTYALAKIFVEFPDEVENLLFKLYGVEGAEWVFAGTVACIFNELSKGVCDLLFKFSDRHAEAVAWAVESYFDNLPEEVRNELLLMLSRKHGSGAYCVAGALEDNFDRLPRDLRNELLLTLSEDDDVVTPHPVARTISSNFHKLPQNIRNLLFKLSEKHPEAVAQAVGSSFASLPDDVRNLLFTLAERNPGVVALWAVEDNLEKLPSDVLDNLLFKISDGAVEDLASILERSFAEFPVETRNKLLIKLSEDDEVSEYVARVVAENFCKLPKTVRGLLFKLSKRDKAAMYVAWAVAKNFDSLPKNVRNLLDKLQVHLQQVLIELSKSERYWKIEAIDLVSKAGPKINEDFVLSMLNRLTKDKDEEVRGKARELMNFMKG